MAGYSSEVCGRFTLSKSASEIAAHFDLPELPALGMGFPEAVGVQATSSDAAAWAPRYNVAPGQDIAVILGPASSEDRRLELRRWGFVPGFARTADEGPRPINARIESAHEKKSFRDAMRRRRCLVPADGFYEWKKEGARKLPHHLALPVGTLFAMAALHEEWEDEEGRVLRTVVLLTTEAEGPARAIHHRMPVILTPEQQELWLDPKWDAADAATRLEASAAMELLARPVGKRVNDVRNDDPACLELEPLPLFGS